MAFKLPTFCLQRSSYFALTSKLLNKTPTGIFKQKYCNYASLLKWTEHNEYDTSIVVPSTPHNKYLHVSSRDHFQENTKTTALAVIDNVKQLSASPKIALLLGAAGLAPFIAAPSYMISAGMFSPAIGLYQTYYGATILSFLGGVRWGLTLPHNAQQFPDLHNLGYSVLAQLWAWSTLVISNYFDCFVVGNTGVMLGLAVTGYMDLAMWGYPAWFKGLRFCLTLGAILSLWTSLMCYFMLNGEENDKQSPPSIQ